MKTIQITGITFLLSLIVVSTAFSAARSWELDKAHSNVFFSVDHIFSKVNGNFNDFKTDINFDPADLAGSKFNFEIKTDSIDTNIGKRDKHLQSADFFDAGKFPLMKFTSTQISDAGNGVYNVAGKLSVKGKDYDLTLPLKLEGVKEHPAKKGTDVAGFNGTITFDRLAHEVGSGKFYEMGVVGKEVDVFVSIELLSDK
jgi:polyisoprenoid-binding protein YceI